MTFIKFTMTVKNIKLNELARKRQDLMRRYDKRQISDTEFLRLDNVYKDEGQKIINILIDKQNINIQEASQMENNEVKETKVEVVKVGKKVQSNSNASLIGKALEMKTIKKVEDLVLKVKEWKPEADEKKIKGMTKTIIREVKAAKGRWKNYTWNDEEYLLTKKE